MGRTVRDTNLETKTARLRLTPRRKPYWRVLESGLHMGYRRTREGGGSWVARRFVGDGKYLETKLGTADDLQDADGVALQTYSQAQGAAKAWWKMAMRVDQGGAPETGPYRVSDALRDYFTAREHAGSKGVANDRQVAAARIIPLLGDVEVEKLTTVRLRAWLDGLAKSDLLVRRKMTDREQPTRAFDRDDDEAVRARKSTANRVFTILKAGLNHAFFSDHAVSDHAWRKVRPFREADAARVRYLTIAEAQRLINASAPDFRLLVRAALATGARYGELTNLRVSDFNPDSETLQVRKSKTAKGRHIVLAAEGAALFAALTAGRPATAVLLSHEDGRPWNKSDQARPMAAACTAGRIDPANFHCLRHTYSSHSIMNGAPLLVIAKNLGHSDTRMVERHYGHMAKSFEAAAIRAAAPAFGGGEKSNVVAIGG
jgi:integrase